MRKKICGLIVIISLILLCAIPDLYDYGNITFEMSIILTAVAAFGMAAGLYGAEAFIFQKLGGKKWDDE